MKWIFIIAIGIFLVWKMSKNVKANNAAEVVLNGLEKHSPDELTEIVQWEFQLRIKLAELKFLSENGKLSDDEFFVMSKVLLEKHREIEQKYNVTEEEMVNYYLASQNVTPP